MGKSSKYRKIHSKWHGQNKTSPKAMLSLCCKHSDLTLALPSSHKPKAFHIQLRQPETSSPQTEEPSNDTRMLLIPFFCPTLLINLCLTLDKFLYPFKFCLRCNKLDNDTEVIWQKNSFLTRSGALALKELQCGWTWVYFKMEGISSSSNQQHHHTEQP